MPSLRRRTTRPWATDLLYGDHFLFGSSGLAAGAGYPIVQVPATNVHGVLLGISFFLVSAFSEPTLIKLASGFEAVTRERAKNPPTFAPMLPDDHINGTTSRKVARQVGTAAWVAARREEIPAAAHVKVS